MTEGSPGSTHIVSGPLTPSASPDGTSRRTYAAPDSGEEEPLRLATPEDLRSAVRSLQQWNAELRQTVIAQHAALEKGAERLNRAAEDKQGLETRLEAETRLRNSAIGRVQETEARLAAETEMKNSFILGHEEAMKDKERMAGEILRLGREIDRVMEVNEGLENRLRDIAFRYDEGSLRDPEGLTYEEAAEQFLRACGLIPTEDAVSQLSDVFLVCLRIMCERGYDSRGATWQAAGWRGQLFEMRKKLERVWWRSWKNGIRAPDSAWDLINYSGFYLRANAWNEPGDGWGRWGEGDGTPPAAARDRDMAEPVDWGSVKLVREEDEYRGPGSAAEGATGADWSKMPFQKGPLFAADPENAPGIPSLLSEYLRKSRAGQHPFPVTPGITDPHAEEPNGEREFGYKDYDAENPGEWFTKHNHGPGVLCVPPCRSSLPRRTRPGHRPGPVAGSGWG